MDNHIRYAMQLSLLKKIFAEELITNREYIAIKGILKKKYKINI